MTNRDVKRFWEKVQKQDGDRCWLWTASTYHGGYGRLRLVNDAGVRTMCRAHRFSWELHHGPIPEELCVLHTCDNPSCVRPDHLWLGTQVENVRDMKAKGRGATLASHGPDAWRRGEQHGRAKLTEEHVREIRALVASGTSRAAVARQFGEIWENIDKIARRKTWRHVE